ncbi:MAG: IS1595 family transposase, partial [Acidobacteriota bacterium]
MICGCKNGISSYEMARDLGVSQKSAWFILHRIRTAMVSGTLDKKLKGEVEVDKSFFGGKVGNMNARAKTRRILKYGSIAENGTGGKAIVMGLLERHGEARVKVVPTRRRGSLIPQIEHHVEEGSAIFLGGHLKTGHTWPLQNRPT